MMGLSHPLMVSSLHAGPTHVRICARSCCGYNVAQVQKFFRDQQKVWWMSRAAVEGCLWGPALMLARAAGDKAFAETAAAMAAATAAPGSPLASLLLMLSGSHDLLLPVKPSTDSSLSKPRAGSSFNLKDLLTKSASKVSPRSSLRASWICNDWPCRLLHLLRLMILSPLHCSCPARAVDHVCTIFAVRDPYVRLLALSQHLSWCCAG